jgi:hypothetical protein
MSEYNKDIVNNYRRKLLLGGLAAGAAGLMQACGGGSSSTQGAVGAGSSDKLLATSSGVVTTPAAIPANQVSLADFGGVPSASASVVKSAFSQAFAKLKGLGGGTLTVAAGIYDMGSYTSETTAVNVADLSNVLVSAYGAEVRLTTNAQVMPVFFNFDNPNNVTIAGMTFRGVNTNLSVNWQGPVCLSVSTSVACSGFKTVDTLADNVVTFFRTYGDYTMTGFDLSGTVSNSYYGINPNFNGRNSRCDITCNNVRRGFMSYGTQDWNIKMRCNGTAGDLGSNGFIDLSPDDTHEVRNCVVDLTVTGDCSMWTALIHFYNQSNYGAFTRAVNCKARLTLNNVTAGRCTGFRFTFEDPNAGFIDTSTITGWEQIELTGSVTGAFAGTLIGNPSISSSPTNSIKVADNLAAMMNMTTLPKYFTVFTPSLQCSA